MRIDVGTTTGGQISSGNDQVLSIAFHARSTNGGSVYVGGSDVGSGSGWELTPDAQIAPSFDLRGMDDHAGRELFSSFYASCPIPGDQVDWYAVLK